MANIDMNFFNSEGRLSLSELQDKLIGFERKFNYGVRNLDSLNVKRINTEVTVIKSSNGTMDLTGEQIRMYDENALLRFRVGLSTDSIYDMTMWSSNSATTDYDASSNASVYINSSGEVTFADKIRTKKDAVVGTVLLVGSDTAYTTGLYAHGIRIRSTPTTDGVDFDAVFRVINSSALVGGQTALEFSLMPSSDAFDSSGAYKFDFISNFGETWLQYGTLHQLSVFSTANGRMRIRCWHETSTNFQNINAVFEGATTNITYLQSSGDIVLLPQRKAYVYSTASTDEIATKGYVYDSSTINDSFVKNVSTDRRLSLDYTTGGAAKLFQNSSLACSLVQGINSTRVINLDYTTDHDNFNVYQNGVLQGSIVMHNSSNGLVVQTTAMGSGQMLRYIRQSSQITQPLMDYTTGLNVQMHMRRLTSTELYFPSTGVWLIFYSSGTYMGKTLLDA